MKSIKLIGLICLIFFTFFYTEKIINISILQDELMIKIKESSSKYNKEPINAKIENNTITPGQKGQNIDINKTYTSMKKLGYFEESLIEYIDVYPDISIYNNYNLYIIRGNPYQKNVSIIYIIKNNNELINITNLLTDKNIDITFFIDSSFLNNNIDIINKIKKYEIYNYGLNGVYTKDNLIITNNIINNKSNNKSTYCLFLKNDIKSHSNCINSKMLSIIPSITGNYTEIKNNLQNGSIILLQNTKELNNIVNFINTKGYTIKPLSNIIIE